MWVTAFADVAELIMGVSVEEFNAFGDEGRKRISWEVRGMKCNMTIGKTVGEKFTNYTVESMEFAGYLPWTRLDSYRYLRNVMLCNVMLRGHRNSHNTCELSALPLPMQCDAARTSQQSQHL